MDVRGQLLDVVVTVKLDKDILGQQTGDVVGLIIEDVGVTVENTGVTVQQAVGVTTEAVGVTTKDVDVTTEDVGVTTENVGVTVQLADVGVTNKIVPVIYIEAIVLKLYCNLPLLFFFFFASFCSVSVCGVSFFFFFGVLVGAAVLGIAPTGGSHSPATNLSSMLSISAFVPKNIFTCDSIYIHYAVLFTSSYNSSLMLYFLFTNGNNTFLSHIKFARLNNASTHQGHTSFQPKYHSIL